MTGTIAGFTVGANISVCDPSNQIHHEKNRIEHHETAKQDNQNNKFVVGGIVYRCNSASEEAHTSRKTNAIPANMLKTEMTSVCMEEACLEAASRDSWADARLLVMESVLEEISSILCSF